MSAVGPWLAIAGLGAFHGLNPAMGWLFAVALGLHRGGAATVAWAALPIGIGHALAVAAVVAAFLAAGVMVDRAAIRWGAALLLVAVAGWHAWRGHRGRVRVGMRAGLGGLAAWSFLMATAHGAGLMLIPALIPLCLAGAPAAGALAGGAPSLALAAVLLHTAMMLAVMTAIALAVHRWVGVAFLRRGWLNLDRVWTVALLGTALAVIAL